MKVYWKVLILKLASWIVAEITLNLVGLDNLANYSEFLSQAHLQADRWDMTITRALAGRIKVGIDSFF